MKSVLTGILAATVLALVAALVLNTEVQESATQAYQTPGVRL
jgi:hypothetical protein